MTSKKAEKRKCHYTDELQSKYPCFIKGRNEFEARCEIFDSFVSVASTGKIALEKHIKTPKHNAQIQESSTSRAMSEFVVNKSTSEALKVWAIEGTLAFHTVKHHQSYRSMDCTSNLIRSLFDDSKVVTKLSCARTKTESIINGVLSKYSIELVIQNLENIPFLSISTDASNHGNLKMFPLVLQYFDHTAGGIQVRLLDLKQTSNEKAQTVSRLIIDALIENGLKVKLIAFAGDNTNTNFGGLNRKSGENIFTHLKTLLNSNLIGIGCPAHILNNGIHHGLDQFGEFDIESIVVKIFNYFSIYTVRTHELQEFCEFVEVEFRNLLSHCKTRWLTLLPAVQRILQMFPALKSYFLSVKEPPKILYLFFTNEFSELHFLFVQSLMSIFFDKMKALERQENSALEILSIIRDISKSLKNRYDSGFLPFMVKTQLNKLRDDGKDKACDKFVESAMAVYERTETYLSKWTESLHELQVFEWLDFQPEKEIKYEYVEKTIAFLVEKNVEIDDNKLFDQIMNLTNFLRAKSNDVVQFKNL